MFYIGQKVMCVDTSPWLRNCSFGEDEALIKGQIYTVRRSFIDDDGDEILWLDEICRSKHSRALWGQNAGYGAHRFRPVQARNTDISIFTSILDGVKSKEPAH